jgi:VWFA-related protein
MKTSLIIVCLAFVPYSFGQRPAASPTPGQSASPEKARTRDFGSSLKKYEKKKRQNSQDKQKSNDPNDEEIVRVETDLIINDVLVTNQKGNLIIGLQKDDFIVTEDGVPQRIEMFSPRETANVPRSMVLIIDCLAPQAPYLKNSIAAGKILVDKLAPSDKMALVTVDLKLRLDFTNDKALLKRTLDSLEKEDVGIWGGWQFSSLLAVLNEMFSDQNRQRIVIFQGGGNEIIWLKPDKDAPYPVSYSTLERSGLRYARQSYLPKFGFSEVKEAIERSRATIYSIIPGIRFLGLSKDEQIARAKITLAESNRFFGGKESGLPTIIREYQWAEAERKTAGQTAMFKVAQLSGGFADFLENPDDAENVYLNIFTVIKNRYVIGYYPTNRNRDGKRREVKIEVRNHPEFIVTGRKAYFLQ